MADVKQILVVDDHFEMLEFLRSMLELSGQDYEVLAVPSAEEAMLELRRGNFDLLITDVRLPGMSGFDLIRWGQKAKLKLPVIMITAYSSSQGRKEAADLGVAHYFQKPLETDDVLTAVTQILHGGTPPTGISSSTAVAFTLTDDLRKRLETLRVDTGALQLLLSSIDGQVLHTIGAGPRLDLDKLSTIIARNVSDSYLLAEEIGSKQPFTLQYHAGARLELYCANIGKQYFLTMFFDAAARRGRIGTIWVFAQRAIKELQSLLPNQPPKQAPPLVSSKPSRRRQSPITQPTAVKAPAPKQPTPPPVAPPPVVEAEPEEIVLVPAENLPVNITIIDNAAEPTTAVEEPTAVLDMNLDELQALLAGTDVPVDENADLDAFWDDAFSSESDEESQLKGLSLEEALQKGLIDKPDLPE